ncbi:hypothetical protein F6W96_26055 [Nocardia terpenica]|uniref:Uncharacterized protein n=2 Tax=Nocardia terpenica TaxID=455432 RepID=A0A6G9Z754_9NOCA|nr:hypothetical protein F6W96_26055 [Nocardia terpenica]
MPNAMKRKGSAFERSQRDYARANGFPHCETTRAGYQRDAGDNHLDPVNGLGVGVIQQCKNTRAPQWNTWVAELEAQKREAKADFAFLTWKRRGVADPGEQFALMPVREVLKLLRCAGYGQEWPHDERP